MGLKLPAMKKYFRLIYRGPSDPVSDLPTNSPGRRIGLIVGSAVDKPITEVTCKIVRGHSHGELTGGERFLWRPFGDGQVSYFNQMPVRIHEVSHVIIVSDMTFKLSMSHLEYRCL